MWRTVAAICAVILVAGLVLVGIIFAVDSRSTETGVETKAKTFTIDGDLEIISTQFIHVEGYPDDTIVIKCRDKANGKLVYIMQGYRKGGISVVDDK